MGSSWIHPYLSIAGEYLTHHNVFFIEKGLVNHKSCIGEDLIVYSYTNINCKQNESKILLA